MHAMLLQQYTYTLHNDLGFLLDISFVKDSRFRFDGDLSGYEEQSGCRHYSGTVWSNGLDPGGVLGKGDGTDKGQQ
jgi:hypothetical protein